MKMKIRNDFFVGLPFHFQLINQLIIVYTVKLQKFKYNII
jgi:hypothetical protein